MMSLLIRNGLLMTMTEQGCIHADILIRQGRIAGISPFIDPGEIQEASILDARDHVITPGLIDIDIPDTGIDARHMDDSAMSAGITTLLYQPEPPDTKCIMIDADGHHHSGFRYLDPDMLTDAQLASQLFEDHGGVICPIRSEGHCRRVLKAADQTGTRPILADYGGCASMTQEIAAIGCSVIIGVHRSKICSPWAMGARLVSLGATVAVSSRYPAAQMKLLPVCAALCVRDGMSSESALQTITSSPAAMLGLEDRGRIEVGLRANLAIFDGDPLLLATSHVMTIAGGRIYRKI